MEIEVADVAFDVNGPSKAVKGAYRLAQASVGDEALRVRLQLLAVEDGGRDEETAKH